MIVRQRQAHPRPFEHGLESARGAFPGALSCTYLDVASRGLLPASALSIAQAHLLRRMKGTANKDAYFETIEACRASFAALVGATPEEVAITKNVSEGINAVAASLDWRAGDEVLVCAALEHPNNLYAWRALERHGVILRDLPAQGDAFPLEAVAQALAIDGHRVRVVAVSATSLVPGLRVDLDRLGEACRAAGVRLVVDGAQSVGIMHWDLSRTPVDALAVGAQKGLCAEYGLGFLYVRREFADQLRPRYLARFGVDVGAADEADYEPGPLRYKPGALRFDLGNYDFLAAALVQDSLALLSRVGTRAIERRVVGLAQALCMSLQAVGMRCVPAPPGALANIVCLDPGPDPAVGHALHQHLRRDGVHVALRRRLLRFSFHLYNDASDVETAALSCRRWREGAR